jgi:hypothetical protein
MVLQSAIRNALQALGGEVSLEKDGAAYRFFACIQPDAYQTQEGSRPLQTRFGKTDLRQYLLRPAENGGELWKTGCCSGRVKRPTSCSSAVISAGRGNRFTGGLC